MALGALAAQALGALFSPANRRAACEIWTTSAPARVDGAIPIVVGTLRAIAEGVPHFSLHTDYVEMFPDAPHLRIPRAALDAEAGLVLRVLAEPPYVAFRFATEDPLAGTRLLRDFRGDAELAKYYDPRPLLKDYLSVLLAHAAAEEEEANVFEEARDAVRAAITSCLVSPAPCPDENPALEKEAELLALLAADAEASAPERLALLAAAEAEEEGLAARMRRERATRDAAWRRARIEVLEVETRELQATHRAAKKKNDVSNFLRLALEELRAPDLRAKFRANRRATSFPRERPIANRID